MTDNELLLAMSELLDTKLKAELQPIKDDIHTLKRDVQTLKGEMQVMKAEMQTVQGNLYRIKSHQEKFLCARLDTIEACIENNLTSRA